MRLVAWNCAMAFHRKYEAVLGERFDVAVIGECAAPDVLRQRMNARQLRRLGQLVWVGDNPNKGLAIFARRGYSLRLDQSHDAGLRFLAPLHVEGPVRFGLLAAWAQNMSGGNTRKDQPGPLRIGLDRYHDFLLKGACLLAGDLNNNEIWDRPGWPINQREAVDRLAAVGMHSVYHSLRAEQQGKERTPTIYWRDRTLHGPRYHLDYVFAPESWLGRSELRVGSFRKWVGSGLSDHVPLIYDFREA